MNPRKYLETAASKFGGSFAELGKATGYAERTLHRVKRGEIALADKLRTAVERALLLQEQIIMQREAEEPPTVREKPANGSGARGLLRRAREARDLPLAELARLTGLKAVYLRELEDGTAPLSEASAKKLAPALGIEPDELLAGSDSPLVVDLTGRTGTVGSTPHIEFSDPVKSARYVPRLSYAQAGALREWTDDLYAYEGLLAIDLPPKSRAFSLKIQGDSMEPRFFAGDDVIVLWGVVPRNGQVVVACTELGEPICKIYHEPAAGQVMLTSYNAAHHPPLTFARGDLRWVWPVHSVNRQVMQP